MATRIDDTTRAEMRQLAARYPQPQSALLPMLHLAQSVDGYVTPEAIEECSAVLGITAAEVAAVATFYTMYKRRPVGEYHVGVCTNTLCAVMGGDAIFERLKDHLDVGNDETTEDGTITLEHIECNAACDYAPVVMVNWEFFDKQTPESAITLVDDLREGRAVTATRGATITGWRAAERVIAGFPDGRANEGPTAGPESLVGLVIARERGWTAPTADGRGSTGSSLPDHPVAATEQSDTVRAESETKAEEARGTTGAPQPASTPRTTSERRPSSGRDQGKEST